MRARSLHCALLIKAPRNYRGRNCFFRRSHKAVVSPPLPFVARREKPSERFDFYSFTFFLSRSRSRRTVLVERFRSTRFSGNLGYSLAIARMKLVEQCFRM